VRTIAVINRKGGSGKTTTAVNTAAALAEIRPRILIIDMDPQGSASDWLARRGDERGLGEAFQRTFDLTRLVTPTDVTGLDIIAASDWLVTAERSMQGELSLGISRAIRRLPARWSYVLVDCPPSLSYLTIGVLMGVNELVIPVEAHAMALAGADAIIDELPSIQGLNPGLRATHMLPCRVTRTVHARGVVETLATDYPTMITQTRIRETIRLAEAADAQVPITRFAPDGTGSADYRAFAHELDGSPVQAATATEHGPRRWNRLQRAVREHR
jgi:chromosome partitioning protein